MSIWHIQQTKHLLPETRQKGWCYMKHIIDDGFNAELVAKAYFDGIMEIPILSKPKEIIIPSAVIPFSMTNRSTDHSEFVHFYEHDKRFSDVLTATKEQLPILQEFAGVISPDCSLYRDMPLCLQIANTYMNRAVGYYLQSQGLYVIPNVRWGDERTYTTVELPEKIDVIYNNRSENKQVAVMWDETQIAAMDSTKGGSYEITGTLEDGTAVTCQVEIVMTNLVKNPSFEEADASMWKVTYVGEDNPTDFQVKAHIP